MSINQSRPTGGYIEDLREAYAGVSLSPIVEGLIYPGLNVLIGSPKAGKSNFGYQIAEAVTNGTPVFAGSEGFRATKGKAFYLSLEEQPELIASRTNKMNMNAAKDMLYVETKFPTMAGGGLVKIGNMMSTEPELSLIVVDILERFKGGQGSSYKADYANLSQLHKLANEYGVGVVLLHHTTKKIPKNWQTAAYGTQALTGVADTTVLIDRPKFTSDGRLCITGRKCRTSEWTTKFDDTTLRWQMVGEVKETSLTDERREILEALQDKCGGFMSPKEIACNTGLNNKSVHNLLKKLEKIELVDKVKHGQYRLTPLGLKALAD
ncbi:AAA family ATPase [Maridesulfovibrio sp.]|uniref:AAA family ATPase n=1 Tax=Maridesulfovibrio sp. TaxID=2795000 RepID=UPI0039F0DBB6